MRILLAVTALLSLLVCLAVPVFYFLELLPEGSFKLALTFASLGYFFLATAWASHWKKST